jgi:hypothetical protein
MWHVWGRREMHTWYQLGGVKEIRHLENLG